MKKIKLPIGLVFMLAMMHERHFTVPLGIAVQDGNYIGETGNTDEETKKKPHNNMVPLLHGFAKDFIVSKKSIQRQ